MKKLILVLLFATIAQAKENQFEVLANGIYQIEGGNKTAHPYGIKSIKTNGDKTYARKICLNTIKNNYKRWQKTDKSISFLDFLANRYCPVQCDAVGNKHWKNNIKQFAQKNKLDFSSR